MVHSSGSIPEHASNLINVTMNYLSNSVNGINAFNERQKIKVNVTKETVMGWETKTIFASLARLNRLSNDARVLKFEQA